MTLPSFEEMLLPLILSLEWTFHANFTFGLIIFYTFFFPPFLKKLPAIKQGKNKCMPHVPLGNIENTLRQAYKMNTAVLDDLEIIWNHLLK
jgi:hypothetical protein